MNWIMKNGLEFLKKRQEVSRSNCTLLSDVLVDIAFWISDECLRWITELEFNPTSDKVYRIGCSFINYLLVGITFCNFLSF